VRRVALRCPDCEQFVSYDDEPQVEINDDAVDDGQYTVDFTVTLLCGECGTELKQTEIECCVDVGHNCQANGDEQEDPQLEFTVEDHEIEFTERFQTHDRHGKPIKLSRYSKHYYGGKVTATLRCETCEEQFAITAEDDCPASSFEEM
jgi:uncharacterized CHY-type Zn-finger protein